MSEREAGKIYDLGYQRYEGARLGRGHAVWVLYRESLRSAFGLGRRAAAKIAPAILAIIAIIPAVLQVLVGVFGGGEGMEVARHDEYYTLIFVVLVLNVAIIAPDIVGRDQRNRTLSLYFTRAISRADYVLAKFLALVSAMLLVTLVPQLVMFVGNAFVADSFTDHAVDNLDQIAPIVAAAVLGSALIASIGAAVAAQTPQRVLATVGIIAAFLLPHVVANALVESIDSLSARLAIFISPVALIDGFTSWMFRVEPERVVLMADFALETYALGAVALAGICYAILLRRYLQVAP